MSKIPPYLKKGDTIGIVCPAGYMKREKAETCIRVLEEWGFQVKVGNTLGSGSPTYFSGTDEERLADFQEMLDDKNVKAILCGRGGYGTGRIIDKINFTKFKKNPKWIIGYSDITVLHAHVYRRYKISTLHSPMAAAFNDNGFENEYVQSLRKVITGKKMKYSVNVNPFNHKGKASGVLIGGNLSILAHLVGTPSAFPAKGNILFIEDVGEQLYNIDRMLHQLKRSGMLAKLSGIIFGSFTETKDTERPFGKTIYEVLSEIVKDYNYPVCYDFPVSHGNENYSLKVGVKCWLKVGKKKVILEEK